MSSKYIRGWNENKLLRFNDQVLRLDVADSPTPTGTFLQQTYEGPYTYALWVDSSDYVYLGGTFTAIDGSILPRIVKLNDDGTINRQFDTAGYGFNNIPYEFYMDASQRLLACGDFTKYRNGTYTKFIGINKDDGQVATGFVNQNVSGTVYTIWSGDSSGRIFLGPANTKGQVYLHHPNNTLDAAFKGGGLMNFFNSSVMAFAADASNRLYIGGQFTTYDSLTQKYLVRTDRLGNRDMTWDVSNGFNAQVTDIQIDSSGNIYIAGDFGTYFGTSCGKLAKLTINSTTLDASFNANLGSGFNAIIQKIRLDVARNRIYAVGNFTTVNGQSKKGLVALKLDGTIDTTFDVSGGFTDSIFSDTTPWTQKVMVDSNGKVYVTGYFSKYSGVYTGPFVRLNTDGTLDNYSV